MRARFPVAVHLFFLRGDQILLLRRFNTGYEDGKYSVVAGHLEAGKGGQRRAKAGEDRPNARTPEHPGGETVTQAAIREAREEAGVTLAPDDLQVVHVMNRKSEPGRSESGRIDFFVVVRRWAGEITNTEPHKCDQLAWFPLKSLPQNMVPYVKYAIERYQEGSYYSEFGWA